MKFSARAMQQHKADLWVNPRTASSFVLASRTTAAMAVGAILRARPEGAGGRREEEGGGGWRDWCGGGRGQEEDKKAK